MSRLKRELARSRQIEWAEFLRDHDALTPEQARQALEIEDGSAMDEAILKRGWLSGAQLEELAREFRRLEFGETLSPLPPDAHEASLKTDRRQGNCILTTPLGRGGASEVWKAWDLSMGRWVAFKRSLLPASSEKARERFRREALAAGRLLHPNIVPIYSTGDSDGQPWLVMALIDGTTLEECRLPLRRTLELLKTIAEAVQFAHDHGVIHRDLKPANLLLDRSGTPWVCDFGIAHLHEATRLTATGAVMGTAPYMAPEQATGTVVEHAESLDVYALGATLYKLATGTLPFDGESFAEVFRKVAESEPLPPRRIDPAIPPDVEAIIQKAMDRDPRRRYESARAFAEDLGRHLRGEQVLARPLSPITRLLRRRKFRTAAAAGVLALGLAAAGWTTWEKPSHDAALARLEAARMELDGATALLYDSEAPAERLRSRLARARDLVRRTLDSAPQLALAHHRHGEVLELEGRFEEAQSSWETALKIDPGLAAARFRLGKVLLTRASLANMNTWNEPRVSRLAESEALAAEGARQIERTRTQESGFETDLEKELASAMRAYARGERETVYGICQEAILRFKGQRGVEEFHWLDGLSREPDNREASVASYTRALEARPKFGLALFCRAMDLRTLGRNPKIMADLDQVIQLCPGFSDALLTRGYLHNSTRNHSAAIADFDALIREGKQVAAATNGKGHARWKLGDLDGAIADLTTAIRLEPEAYASAYGHLARISLEKGDVDGAIRDASKGHQVGKSQFCKLVLVDALAAGKDVAAGMACLDRLGIAPDDPCRRLLQEKIAR